MLKEERQNRILELCKTQEMVSVQEFADALGVSTMTVRRDLEELSAARKLLRVHGGARGYDSADVSAVLRKQALSELGIAESASKDLIRAAKNVQRDEVIYLGEGALLAQMAHLLPDVRLRVVTNNIKALPALMRKERIETMLVGGALDKALGYSTGPMAKEAIESIGTDRAFVGASGVCAGFVYTASAEAADLCRAACENATKSYLVVTQDALEQRGFFKCVSVDAFTEIIVG